MRNWKWRSEIPWATFCWKRNFVFTVYHLNNGMITRIAFNQVFCNALVLYDKWNQGLEQTNGAETRRTVRKWLVHIPNHRFQYECGKMALKYRETGNVLETIRFQRQFPNRNVHFCRRPCSNLTHTGHTYCNCPLLFVCMVSSDSETAFETFWLFLEHYRFLYTLKP